MRIEQGKRFQGAPDRTGKAAAKEESFVAFRVGEERFLLEILRVKEVVRYGKTTAIPNAPAAIADVIELRGSYVPILDMRARLGLPAKAPTSRSRIIVSLVRGRVAGLLVDELPAVMRLAPSELKLPPPVTKDLGYDFLKGMCTRGGEVYMFIDSDRLLDPDRLRVQQPDATARSWGDVAGNGIPGEEQE